MLHSELFYSGLSMAIHSVSSRLSPIASPCPSLANQTSSSVMTLLITSTSNAFSPLSVFIS